MYFVILSQITEAIPSTHLTSSVRCRYQHLLLADKDFNILTRIDVIFGANVFPSFIYSHDGFEHYVGIPSASNPKLGRIIFGSFSTSNTTPLFALTNAIDRSIGDQLPRFWLIEKPVTPVLSTTKDQWCEDYFSKSTSHDLSGRFCVAFTFRNLFTISDSLTSKFSDGLGDSCVNALKRFYNLEKRLNKDPDLYV